MMIFRHCAPLGTRLCQIWGQIRGRRGPSGPINVSFPMISSFVVLITSIICCYQIRMGLNDDLDMEFIYESRLCQDSMLISAIIGTPMIIDMILDGFVVNRATVTEQIHWAMRLVLLMSLMLPGIFLFTGTITGQLSAHALLSIIAVMNVTSRGCIAIFLSQDHHKIVIGPVCVSICITYGVAELLGLQDFFYPSESYMTMSILFIAITWAQYLYIFYKWQSSWIRSGREKKSDDVCIAMYLSSLCVLSVGTLLVSVIKYDPEDVDLNPIKVTFLMYIQILFTVASTTVSGRMARFNLQKTTHTMDERQAFVRYISHELRTPLNAVFLGMSFIKEELSNISPVVKEYVDHIVETVEDVNNCCEIAISILNDLLTFDKLEEGKMTLEFEETLIEEYVADAVKPFRVEARQKNIEISVDIVECSTRWSALAALQVDRHKMSQVIRNLLSNALKFTPSNGSVSVVMTCVSRGSPDILELKTASLFRSIRGRNNSVQPCDIPEDDGNTVDYIRIEIKDSGAGISEENQKRLFGQYVQFHAGKLQKGNGSGLGLWISKGIVTLHGGYIGGYSAGEGKGSTFFVELPLYPRGLDSSLHSVLRNNINKSIVGGKGVVIPDTDRKNSVSSNRSVFAFSSRNSEVITRSKCFMDDAHKMFEVTPISRRGSCTSNRNKSVSCVYDGKQIDECKGYTAETRPASALQSLRGSTHDGIGPKMNILVVDDSNATRKVMVRLLTHKGYTVNTAEDGVGCLRIMEEVGMKDGGTKDGGSGYSLIIIDDIMPNMGGPAACKILRASGYKGLICGVTGNTCPADVSNFRNHGATLVLPKPLDVNLMEKILKDFLP